MVFRVLVILVYFFFGFGDGSLCFCVVFLVEGLDLSRLDFFCFWCLWVWCGCFCWYSFWGVGLLLFWRWKLFVFRGVGRFVFGYWLSVGLGIRSGMSCFRNYLILNLFRIIKGLYLEGNLFSLVIEVCYFVSWRFNFSFFWMKCRVLVVYLFCLFGL